MRTTKVVLWMGCVLGCFGAIAETPSTDAVSAETHGPLELSATVIPQSRVIDQPNALLLALKRNDWAGIQQSIENKSLGEIERKWNEQAQRSERKDEAGDVHGIEREFESVWQELATDEGVEQLVAEWQPKIAEESSKAVTQFNFGFGAALAAIAADQDLPFERAQQLTQLLQATQAWTARVDFADPKRLRRGLDAVARVVRQTGAKSFDEFSRLPFEDAAVHGDAMIGAVKQVLESYDIPVGEILDSVRISEVDAHGDRAVLRVDARVFGVDVTHEWPMRYYNHRWLDVAMAEWFEEQQRSIDERAKSQEPAPEAHAAGETESLSCDKQ